MIEETVLIEQNSQTKNPYQISPEMRRSARAKLKKIISEKGIKRFSKRDFETPNNQSQEKIRADVDDFLRLREEWRKENRDRDFD